MFGISNINHNTTVKYNLTPTPQLNNPPISLKEDDVSSSNEVEKFCFKNDSQPASASNNETVRNAHNIKDARELASLRPLSPENAKELDELAQKMLEVFEQKKTKDLSVWHEVLSLVASPDIKQKNVLYLSKEIDKIVAAQKDTFDLSALQNITILIHNLPQHFSKVTAGYITQILTNSIAYLKRKTEVSAIKNQLFLQAISQVVDAVNKVDIIGILHKRITERLSEILSELEKTLELPLELQFQVHYIRQALAHIPRGDIGWQQAWFDGEARAKLGAPDLVSAIRQSDRYNSLAEAFDYFLEAFIDKQANEIEVNSTIPNDSKQLYWYVALQFLDICLEAGQFVQFEMFAEQSIFKENVYFSLGLCQRLEHIAHLHSDTDVQGAAKQFLESLANSKEESVMGAAKAVLERLGLSPQQKLRNTLDDISSKHLHNFAMQKAVKQFLESLNKNQGEEEHDYIAGTENAALKLLQKPPANNQQDYVPTWFLTKHASLGTQLLDEARAKLLKIE